MDSNQRKKDQNKFKQIMNYFYRLLKVSCLYLFSKAVQLWMMPCHVPDSILILLFSEPTQIYRYLRTRNLISPIFLNRNLTFMKKRMTRSNEGRKMFKIDSLLERRVKEDSDMCVTNLGSYMTLTFLGYYDSSVSKAASERPAQLELMLVKQCLKKRKESSSPVIQQSLGLSEVPVNPSEQNPPSKAPALSIPSKSFSLSGVGSVGRIKTYSLLVKVNCGGVAEEDGGQDTENQEPSAKRRKTAKGGEEEPGRAVSAELSRCLLTEGDYELVLDDTADTATPRSNSVHYSSHAPLPLHIPSPKQLLKSTRIVTPSSSLLTSSQPSEELQTRGGCRRGRGPRRRPRPRRCG